MITQNDILKEIKTYLTANLNTKIAAENVSRPTPVIDTLQAQHFILDELDFEKYQNQCCIFIQNGNESSEFITMATEITTANPTLHIVLRKDTSSNLREKSTKYYSALKSCLNNFTSINIEFLSFASSEYISSTPELPYAIRTLELEIKY